MNYPYCKFLFLYSTLLIVHTNLRHSTCFTMFQILFCFSDRLRKYYNQLTQQFLSSYQIVFCIEGAPHGFKSNLKTRVRICVYRGSGVSVVDCGNYYNSLVNDWSKRFTLVSNYDRLAEGLLARAFYQKASHDIAKLWRNKLGWEGCLLNVPYSDHSIRWNLVAFCIFDVHNVVGGF